MRLGIVSDTHDRIDAIERAVEVFRDAGVSVVIHCGDIATADLVRRFDEFEFHAVLGNNDDRDALAATIADLSDGNFHGLFADLRFDGLRIAALHGVVKETIYEHAAEDTYDYVLHGHFHETEESVYGETTVLNPGAHHSVIVLDTDTEAIRFVDL
jgi:hypothetical protein